MRKLVLFVAMLGVLGLAACAPRTVAEQKISVAGGAYTSVSPAGLQQMLKAKDFVLVNVHIPFAGSIAGTDVSIPYDAIGQQLSQLPPDTSAKIVLYCRSGHMSTLAAETLVKLGYTNVWTLEGGMQAWQAAGFPLQDKQ